jgi:hypothetical protein
LAGWLRQPVETINNKGWLAGFAKVGFEWGRTAHPSKTHL